MFMKTFAAAAAGGEIYIANALIAVFILGGVTWIIVHLLRREFSTIRSVPVSAEVTVLSKRKRVLVGNSVTSLSNCYAEFMFTDGKVRELRIPRDEYERITPEDSGMLVHKGALFVSFEPLR